MLVALLVTSSTSESSLMLVVLPQQTEENDVILLLKCYHIEHTLTDIYCIKVPSVSVEYDHVQQYVLVKDKYQNFKAYLTSLKR